MAILEHPEQAAARLAGERSSVRRWNRDEYYRMARQGILSPDERVELIHGEVISLAPIGPPHRKAMIKLYDILHDAAGHNFYVMPESPIVLADNSEPQPDVAIARGPESAYDERHPEAGDVVLIVEVSDTTLTTDRTSKMRLYAQSGIPEYWIVNLVDRQLEVHREPSSIGYGSVQIYTPDQTITPLFALAAIKIADFIRPAS